MAQPFRMHLKMVIRFSFLSEGGFSNSSAGIGAVREMLYNPARLERRFAMFEALTLPALAAQTSHDLDVIVLTGDTLPVAARDHLEQILSPYPWVRVIALPVGGQFPAIKAALDMVPSPPGTTHVGTMRMDDDDAIKTILVEHTHGIAPHIAGATNGAPFVISYQSGVFATLGGGEIAMQDVTVRNPLGIGLTLVAPIDYPGNVFRRNHRALAQYYPVFADATPRMFLRTIHRDNDSNPVDPDGFKTLGPKRARFVLKTAFGIRPDSMAALG